MEGLEAVLTVLLEAIVSTELLLLALQISGQLLELLLVLLAYLVKNAQLLDQHLAHLVSTLLLQLLALIVQLGLFVLISSTRSQIHLVPTLI